MQHNTNSTTFILVVFLQIAGKNKEKTIEENKYIVKEKLIMKRKGKVN